VTITCFFWYDQISQKESLEWRSRGAFPALAVFLRCCDKFVAQIETFAAHIGDTTQGADIHSSLFVTKSVTFVSHQNVCVTQCVGSTPPPPLYACFRSLKTSGSRDLCTPTVVGVVGREGIPEVWLGCRGRGRVDEG